MYEGLNMGHEYGACLEGSNGKLERKNGEDEHERKSLPCMYPQTSQVHTEGLVLQHVCVFT